MIGRYFKYLLVLYFVFVRIFSQAQHYNFKNYTPQNGLAASLIYNIFQDSKGYIWFATQGGGVSRFNGKEFKNFAKHDGLVSNEITCIKEDKAGNIWMASATEDGVSKFDGTKFYSYKVKDGLPSNSVYWITVDKQNQIWFATTNGVVKYFDNKFTNISNYGKLSSDTVYSIIEDKNGIYWFSLHNGLASFDGSKLTNYSSEKDIQGKSFFSSFCDHKNNIWLGSSNGEIIKYDGKKFDALLLPETVSHDFIGSITEDKHGNIWFATEHGALKYNGHHFTLFDESKGLSSNIVNSVFSDYEGNIWIGTQQGGACMLNNEAFTEYTTLNGLKNNKITAICQTPDNTYILGTLGSGLMTMNDNFFHSINAIPELNKSIISCLMQDSKFNLWVGTAEGIDVLNKKDGNYVLNRHINTLSNTPLNMIVTIFEDKQGNIWIASYGSGVFKINGNAIKHFSVENGFPSDNILTMFKDSKGKIWVGTNDAGVAKIDGDSITNYTEKDGLSSKSIWSIAEDNNHNLFFGTNDAGINIFDGKKFTNLSAKADALCSNNITTLLWDPTTKSLFAGTDKGLNRISFSKDLKIDSLRYYGEHEGFKGMEVISNAVYKDYNGSIWFGTPNGLYRYQSSLDYSSDIPPRLDLTDIKLSYQTVDWRKFSGNVDNHNNLPSNLELSYSNNHLTFGFQALTTGDVRYTYILEGQDNQWSPLTTVPEANFTNIAPGKSYTFKVRAVNNNGLWSKDDIAYTFTIRPPWWRTWWAYTLYVLSTIISIISFIRYRTSKLEKEKRVLEQKVEERTLELNASNLRLSEAINAITDSMNYAQRIQESFLTSEKLLNKTLKDYFILYKPKDIVSGDFYWAYDMPDRTLIACADSTGHGIPGAFMSLIGISLLNEISHSKAIFDPAEMLNELRRIIMSALNPEQSDDGGKDGMDLALISIFKQREPDGRIKVHFSGANNGLYIVSNKNGVPESTEYKGDKQPAGYYSRMLPFSQKEILVSKGDMLYMYSDGYADQFGGPGEKKFMTSQLKKVLTSIVNYNTQEQQKQLENIFNNWKGEQEQIDDVTVMGIKIE